MASFSNHVWAALRLIPRGKVVTYADLARAIRNPRAVRAVAQACAQNPHPIVVPCHRVVRSDGSLGGYSGPGGVQRKEVLLSREGVAVRNGHIIELSLYRHRFGY